MLASSCVSRITECQYWRGGYKLRNNSLHGTNKDTEAPGSYMIFVYQKQHFHYHISKHMWHSACSLNRSSKNGFLWSNKLKKLHSNPLTSKESPVILFTLRSPKDVWPCFFVPRWIPTNWKLSPGARGVCVHKGTLTPPHCPNRAVCLSTALPNSMWGVLTTPVCSGSIYLRVKNTVNTVWLTDWNAIISSNSSCAWHQGSSKARFSLQPSEHRKHPSTWFLSLGSLPFAWHLTQTGSGKASGVCDPFPTLDQFPTRAGVVFY